MVNAEKRELQSPRRPRCLWGFRNLGTHPVFDSRVQWWAQRAPKILHWGLPRAQPFMGIQKFGHAPLFLIPACNGGAKELPRSSIGGSPGPILLWGFRNLGTHHCFRFPRAMVGPKSSQERNSCEVRNSLREVRNQNGRCARRISATAPGIPLCSRLQGPQVRFAGAHKAGTEFSPTWGPESRNAGKMRQKCPQGAPKVPPGCAKSAPLCTPSS